MIDKNTHIVYITHIIYITYIAYITQIVYIILITYIIHLIKLTFKAYKKTDKIYFHNFFLYMKMLAGYYYKKKQQQKKSFQKRHVKGTKIFLKKKTKSANMLVSDIEIFLKKKKKRSVNMVVNNIKN